jgi:hypothetical protein
LKRFGRHIAFFLLVISSLFVLPKELVHEFCNHHDTEDVANANNNDIAVSPQHQHCEVLQLFYQPYSPVVANVDFQAIVQDVVLNIFYHPHFSIESFKSLDIRGPPALV